MDDSLRRIQSEINRAEHDTNLFFGALKDISENWGSIRTAFTDYSKYLDGFREFPDIESRLELEQITKCDTLIAEIGKQLLLIEHSLTSGRATIAKAKQLCHTKDISEVWNFPPTEVFTGDLFIETQQLIDDVSFKLEAKRLALYHLTAENASINQNSINKFICKWDGTN